MILQDLYRQGLKVLQQHGVPDADLDCAFLLSHLLDVPKNQLFLCERSLTASQQEIFAQCIQRRSTFEPLAYIVGAQEFWSLPFIVTPAVLIPRPETEILVEEVLAVIPEVAEFQGRILDMGTGSGILPITLALELPQGRFTALDLSWEALQVAKQNCRRHDLTSRICLLQSSWYSSLAKNTLFDIIVCNPPYVDPTTFNALQDDVVEYEPHLALDGGEQGRAVITSFCPDVSSYLVPGGWFFMEIGYDQQEYVTSLLAADPLFTQILVRNDYAGLPRIISARRSVEI